MPATDGDAVHIAPVVVQRFLLQLGSPYGQALRRIVASPRLTVLFAHKWKTFLVVFSLWHWFLERRQVLRRRRASAAGAMRTAAPASTTRGTSKEAPTVAFASPPPPTTIEMLAGIEGGDSGGAEYTCIVAAWISCCLVMVRKASLMGKFFTSVCSAHGANGRAPRRWIACAWEYAAVSVLHVLLTETASYAQARLAIKWRRNMTRKLHGMYFSRTAYYKIMQESPDVAVMDADIRICRDVRDMAASTSELVLTLTEAAAKTLICSGAMLMYRPRGWAWMASAPIFFITAVKTTIGIEPLDGVAVQSALQRIEGKLSQLAARVQEHTASICALQGEGFELDLMLKTVRDLCHGLKRRQFVTFFTEMIEWSFLRAPQAASLLELLAAFGAAWLGVHAAVPADNANGVVRLMSTSVARRIGVQIRDVHCFMNVCAGLSTFLTARAKMPHCAYLVARVRQLYERLERLHAHHPPRRRKKRVTSKEPVPPPVQDTTVRDCGPLVSFEGVSASAPSRQQLFRGLTFTVAENESLLISGQSGVGKTAIARCLLQFWPVSSGRMCRPGCGSMAQADCEVPWQQEVCYLPPVPHCPPGPLSDQLTYPLTVPGGLPEAELRRWLRHVDLDYLVDVELCSRSITPLAEDGMESILDPDGYVDWGALLSKQEMQALGMARMFYNRPQFALLDDCTSALPAELEHRLHVGAMEMGITPITVVQKAAVEDPLLARHCRLLELTGSSACSSSASSGDTSSENGWRLSPLRPRSAVPASTTRRIMGCHMGRRSMRRTASDAHMCLEASWRQAGATPSSCSTAAGMPEAFVSLGSMSPESATHRAARAARIAAEGACQAAAFAKASRAAAAREVQRRWPSLISRLWAIIRLGLQTPVRRRDALKRVTALALLLHLRAHVFWLFCRGLSGIARASLTRDLPTVVREAVGGSIFVLLGGLADQLIKHQVVHLTADLWVGAASHLLRRSLRCLSRLRDAQARPLQRLFTLEGVVGLEPEQPETESLLAASADEPVLRAIEVRCVFDSLSTQLIDTLPTLATLAYIAPQLVRTLGARSTVLPIVAASALLLAQRRSLPRAFLSSGEAAHDGAVPAALGRRWPDDAVMSRSCGSGAAAEEGSQDRLLSLHSRLRIGAESSALSGSCAEADKRLAENLLNDVLAEASTARWKELPRRILLSMFIDYRQLPMLLQQLLVLRFVFRASNAWIGSEVGSVACSIFLFDRAVQLLTVAGAQLVRCAEKSWRIDGPCIRCLEVLVACDAVDVASDAPAVKCSVARSAANSSGDYVTAIAPVMSRLASPPNISDEDADAEPGIWSRSASPMDATTHNVTPPSFSSAAGVNLNVNECGSSLAASGVNLVTSRGRPLALGLSFKAEAGEAIAVLGPSASGKSMLGETLLGLRQPSSSSSSSGVTSQDHSSSQPRPPLRLIMPATQRAYLPVGRLYVQLAYPLVLRQPTRPPFEMSVENVPQQVGEDQIFTHFQPLGASSAVMLPALDVSKSYQDVEQKSGSGAGRRRVLVTFKTLDELVFALARPQDHVVQGCGLECEFGRGGASSRGWNLVRMRRCLEAVELDYVLTREADGWFAKRVWEDVLTGEEQQRLCVARVLYHGPTFGLFDDCTSMLSAEAEHRIYQRVLKDWGVTPILLAQRRSPLSSIVASSNSAHSGEPGATGIAPVRGIRLLGASVAVAADGVAPAGWEPL